MGSVFVLTSGMYSSYGIRAVFSTREAAQQTADTMNAANEHDGYEVEEWPLDVVPKIAGCTDVVDVVDGTIGKRWIGRHDVLMDQGFTSVEEHWTGWQRRDTHPDDPITCRIKVLADTYERATKIANERAFQVAAEWDICVAREKERPAAG